MSRPQFFFWRLVLYPASSYPYISSVRILGGHSVCVCLSVLHTTRAMIRCCILTGRTLPTVPSFLPVNNHSPHPPFPFSVTHTDSALKLPPYKYPPTLQTLHPHKHTQLRHQKVRMLWQKEVWVRLGGGLRRLQLE